MQANLYCFLLGVFVALIASAGITLDATSRADNMADEIIRLEIENETLSRRVRVCLGEF